MVCVQMWLGGRVLPSFGSNDPKLGEGGVEKEKEEKEPKKPRTQKQEAASEPGRFTPPSRAFAFSYKHIQFV